MQHVSPEPGRRQDDRFSNVGERAACFLDVCWLGSVLMLENRTGATGEVCFANGRLALTIVSAVDEVTVWRFTVEGLAEVLVISPDEILTEISASGDYVITSKDAEVVISYVEEMLGDVELVDQSHLGRDELTSLRTLSKLLWRRWTKLYGRKANE